MPLQDGVRSGRYGAVDGQSTVRNWSFNLMSEIKTYRASNTRGGTGRVRGVRDWTGSFGAYGGTPLLLPGSYFDFKGYTAPESGVEGDVGPTYGGPAIVDSLAVALNWTSGDILSYVVNFSGDGELLETEEAVVDASEPDVPDFDMASITIDADGSGSGSSFTEWCNLLNATLTITSENKAATNSCSGGWRSRTPGPIDWTLAVTVQETSLARLPFEIDDDVPLRIITGPGETDFWQLNWARILNFSGVNVNTESGDFVQLTINAGKQAFVDGQIGVLTAPGGTQLWPAT